ncbi:hypothetical protein I350_07882 [Cryptococcus amylolentus CBS 6273]|uniref:Uncharacterized protein n=1 Tax=Cryptococcus amylolentus CBS 6273 TaxID=1296118 RepID=A0A1E3JDQ4_9TREE|nr:hypothetical protein I350_07882 [Cryptococcus amylolentus CBS 6273]
MLHPLTSDVKASLFAYGAHLHKSAVTLPSSLFTALGSTSYPRERLSPQDSVPSCSKLPKRPLRPLPSGSLTAVYPGAKTSPSTPRSPWPELSSSRGTARSWNMWKETWEEREGDWQEVFKLLVNGAFTTQNCRALLSALQWAADPSCGDVKVLALMGGGYFFNEIALDTIEHASSPGQETWDNICAIDDIVSFLCSDIFDEQPAFMQGQGKALSERGIVMVACVRWNAAAGGVALATACDVVAGRGFSYLHRCGPVHASEILREMKPLSTSLPLSYGLVDGEIGSGGSSALSSEDLFISAVQIILSSSSTNAPYLAPWARPTKPERSTNDKLAEAKVRYFTTTRTFPPLHHLCQEELSQMLLDSFYPIRSDRYQSRRYLYKFVRKSNDGSTPARYAVHEKERTRLSLMMRLDIGGSQDPAVPFLSDLCAREEDELGSVGGPDGKERSCNLITGKERRIVDPDLGLLSCPCTVETLPLGLFPGLAGEQGQDKGSAAGTPTKGTSAKGAGEGK